MSKRCWATLLVLLMFVLGAPIASAQDKPAAEPKAPSDPPPTEVKVSITVDTSEVPELAEWAEKSKKQCEEWYPKAAQMLASEGFKPAEKMAVVYRKNMRGVAGTSGTRIAVSAKWVKDHPDDFGMVVHEMVHVIQAYPKYEHVWLVEGIADYIRYWHFEPTKQPKFDARKARVTDGYGVTAAFLAYVETTHDKDIVVKLNAALRQTKYNEELWKEYTGKTRDELWQDFVASREKRS